MPGNDRLRFFELAKKLCQELCQMYEGSVNSDVHWTSLTSEVHAFDGLYKDKIDIIWVPQ